MLSRLITILLIVFLAGCIHLPCKKEPSPPLQTVYGFMECGTKKIEFEGKIKTHKVYCLTEEDKSTLEVWMIFWCQ